jgi:hypothetical protein
LLRTSEGEQGINIFDLGSVEVTPAADAALSETGVELAAYLARHRRGDWGEVEDQMVAHNAWALERRGILWSRYALPDGRGLSVATACDRSYTYVMLAAEFEEREVSAQEGYARWADYYDYVFNPLIAVEEPRIDVILGGLQVATALDVGAGTGRQACGHPDRGSRSRDGPQRPGKHHNRGQGRTGSGVLSKMRGPPASCWRVGRQDGGSPRTARGG